MKIQVCIKTVYGNELCYPVCAKAKLLAQLLGVRTFNPRQVQTIKELGYQFELINQFSI